MSDEPGDTSYEDLTGSAEWSIGEFIGEMCRQHVNESSRYTVEMLALAIYADDMRPVPWLRADHETREAYRRVAYEVMGARDAEDLKRAYL